MLTSYMQQCTFTSSTVSGRYLIKSPITDVPSRINFLRFFFGKKLIRSSSVTSVYEASIHWTFSNFEISSHNSLLWTLLTTILRQLI